MAEAILNSLGGGTFQAFSAGSRPAGAVNPFARALLEQKGLATSGLRSKSWDELAGEKFDLVITVCDDAAREPCPVFPGAPLTVHWGLPDPAAVAGSDKEKAAAFADAFKVLSRRIGRLAALPVGGLGPAALKGKLAEIGKLE